MSNCSGHLDGEDAPANVDGQGAHPTEHGQAEEVEEEANNSARVNLGWTRLIFTRANNKVDHNAYGSAEDADAIDQDYVAV